MSALANAPEGLALIDLIGTALEALGVFFSEDRRAFAQLRQAIIVANPALRERELIELATRSGSMADTLHGRGVKEPTATLTADLAIVVFKNAFERRVDECNQLPFAQLVEMSITETSTTTTGE